MDRSDLLAALKRAAIQPVDLRGVQLHVRGMTVAERIEFVSAVRQAKDGAEIPEAFTDAALFARHVVTPEGVAYFADAATVKDAIDAVIVTEVVQKLLEISGLGATSEAAEKNS